VAVDVAVLTVRDDVLQVVVVDHRHGGPALPGTFLHAGERLSDAAARALHDKAGLSNVTFAQLRVFDDPARDDRGWVLSVGHSAALATDRIPVPITRMPVVDGRPARPLLFDHADIVALAVEDLRLRYGRELDPADLLGETFTVLQMRRIYQAVFDRPLVKDTFRRYVIDALEPTGELASAFGRPAELFRRRPGITLPPSAWAFFVSGGR
jgi:8-oxo-dGTP diphosphatase